MDLRTVGQGALLSYRALFTWLNPLGYISSRIVRPVGRPSRSPPCPRTTAPGRAA